MIKKRLRREAKWTTAKTTRATQLKLKRSSLIQKDKPFLMSKSKSKSTNKKSKRKRSQMRHQIRSQKRNPSTKPINSLKCSHSNIQKRTLRRNRKK